jgi:hypothetical protein
MSLCLNIDGKRRIIRKVRDYSEIGFIATYRKHDICVTRRGEDEDHYDFYITVAHPNGCYVYDGYWQIPWDECGDPTIEGAIKEALRGSGLLDP